MSANLLLLSKKPSGLPSEQEAEWEKTKGMGFFEVLNKRYEILKEVCSQYPDSKVACHQAKEQFEFYFSDLKKAYQSNHYKKYEELLEKVRPRAQAEGWFLPSCYAEFVQVLQLKEGNEESIQISRPPDFNEDDFKEFSEREERKIGSIKVLINKCFGSFGVSVEVLKRLVSRNASCIEKHAPENYYGDKERFNSDFEEFFDIGDGFMTDHFGYKVYDGTHLYSLKDGDREVRTDGDLIEVIEEIGEERASGRFANLEIVNIPDDVDFEIDEYDGLETIHESHRKWG